MDYIPGQFLLCALICISVLFCDFSYGSGDIWFTPFSYHYCLSNEVFVTIAVLFILYTETACILLYLTQSLTEAIHSVHCNDVAWASWRLRSLVAGVFVQPLVQADNKWNIKARHSWPLSEESTSEWAIPAQGANNAYSAPMSLRHHVYGIIVGQCIDIPFVIPSGPPFTNMV